MFETHFCCIAALDDNSGARVHVERPCGVWPGPFDPLLLVDYFDIVERRRSSAIVHWPRIVMMA